MIIKCIFIFHFNNTNLFIGKKNKVKKHDESEKKGKFMQLICIELNI